ncbi:ubiquitin carboxyl-terminal hydrolase 5/13 [Pseudohyphozyma bogoriensis]|nr:ubiquitin carboxyl-terminal hydrolase 5/13 [Pseudohyphozyma bogoriensis]
MYRFGPDIGHKLIFISYYRADYSQLQPPRPSQGVYKEECTQCYDSQDGPNGVDVCLTCFNGGCPKGSTNEHGVLHFKHTGHAIFLNIKRRKKVVQKSKRNSQEPPPKKLAIREEPAEHEKYDFETVAKMYVGDDVQVLPPDEKLDSVIAGVLASMSSAQKSEVKAWEEEITSCSHTTNLVQPEPKKLEPAGLASCAHPDCGLTSNLWLCLICGALGCGRQQYGGGGGNGHAVLHTQTTGHPVAVKMGTITPDGGADIYCYACDDARLDPELPKHLANFGIEVASQTKTEKSMTELQIEQNLVFDFAMTGEDGKELEPLMGPGLTGMRNLGNSCYMASSLQSLFALPTFHDRYLTSFFTHTTTCTNPSPATCFECQMSKVADGLLSGRYAVPREPEEPEMMSTEAAEAQKEAPTVLFQEGIRPIMFKALVGKDHPDFSTMKQQDAGEFLLHLFEVIRKSSAASGLENPASIFSFAFEERLQCAECKRVRYKVADGEFLPLSIPAVEKKSDEMAVEGEEKKTEYESVELTDCLDSFTSPAEVEYKCPACESKAAIKTTRFATFPDALIITPNRFPTVNWVPRKIEIPLNVPIQSLSLDKFIGHGKQADEEELPDTDDQPAAGPVFDAGAMAQLTGMGFPEIRCQRALLATGNTGDAEAAMNWLFGHMDDPAIDDPLPATAAAAPAGAPDEQIESLVAMGFTPAQGRKALRESGGNMERAVEWLFNNEGDEGDLEPVAAADPAAPKPPPGSSKLPANYRLKAFISHKGPSPHSGHYVAHVWTGDEKGWVLFNDEKVVHAESGAQSAEVLAPQAHVYFYEKISS